MSAKPDRFLDRVVFRRSLVAWDRAGAAVDQMDLAALRSLRGRAWQVRRSIDRVINVADGRLALPVIGGNAVPAPLGTDWAYRPDLFRTPISPPGAATVPARTGFGTEASVHHDCTCPELTFRQIRNTRAEDVAPFAARLEVFHFDGSFLSLVIDLPPEACTGLRRNHVIRLDPIVETECPLDIYARLNVKHGPNVEQVVRKLPLGEAEIAVEFDLAYTDLNEKRVEKAWIDLIFEGPGMNRIILRDLTLTRRPRAEL